MLITKHFNRLRRISVDWRDGGRCVGLSTLPPSCADCLEICELHHPATLMVCPGLYRDCLTVAFTWSKRSLPNSAVFIMRSARAIKHLMMNYAPDTYASPTYGMRPNSASVHLKLLLRSKTKFPHSSEFQFSFLLNTVQKATVDAISCNTLSSNTNVLFYRWTLQFSCCCFVAGR